MAVTAADYLEALKRVLSSLEAGDWQASETAAARCDQLTAELRAGNVWLDRAQLDEASMLHARCMAAVSAGASGLRERAQERTQTRAAIAAYGAYRRG